MIVMGVDPSPVGYSWAYYSEDESGRRITAWGDSALDLWPEDCPKIVGLETVSVGGYGTTVDKNVFKTAESVGRIAAMLEFRGCKVYLVSRKTVAARLVGVVKGGGSYGDRQINAAVNRLVPGFARVRKGLNGHHRASAAVAITTFGLHQTQTVLGLAK